MLRVDGAKALGPAPAKALSPMAASGQPKPAVAQDSLALSDPKAFRVITFNTAVGNPAITTKQKDFLQLPFYQELLQGKPNAPVLCLQEVGNEQRAAVEKLAKEGAPFTILASRVGANQHDMMLIPKRFEVTKKETHRFLGIQLKAFVRTTFNWLFKGGEKPTFTQLIAPRGFLQATARDRVTGQQITFIDTHLSYWKELRADQADKLMKHARAAEGLGPVVVAGDLNVRTADTDSAKHAKDAYAATRAHLAGYTDAGPSGNPPDRSNIDWVLVKGLKPVASKWHTGDSLSLPGSPNAKAVSDHYAEEDVVTWP